MINDINTNNDSKNWIKSFIFRLKKMIFLASNELLKNNNEHNTLLVIFYIIYFVQIILLNFHPNIVYIWKDNNYSLLLSRIYGYLSVTFILKQNNILIFYLFYGFTVFFLLIFFINLVFLNYFSAGSKIKKFYLNYIFKFYFYSFSTIFFILTYEVLLFVMNCNYFDINLENNYINSIRCWTGNYIIISIISIIYLLIFFSVILFILKSYNDERPTINKINVLNPNNIFFNINLYLIITIFWYSIFKDKKFTFMNLGISLIQCFFISIKINKLNIWNSKINNIFNIFSKINWWTILLLNLSFYLGDNEFMGSFNFWITGLIIIFIFQILKENHYYSILLKKPDEIKNFNDFYYYIILILNCINLYNDNKMYKEVLDGFIEVHKFNCNDNECVIYNISEQNVFYDKDNYNTNLKISILYLNRILFYGIQKFKNINKLRLLYSYFLIDIMKRKQQAYKEINFIENSSPSFDEEFTIYRLNKLLEDNNNLKSYSEEVNTELFNINFKQFKNLLENCSNLHLEFWKILFDYIPDISRVSDIGFEINSVLKQIKFKLEKINSINPNNINLLKLYGKFYSEILNDNYKGQYYLEKSRNLILINDNFKEINKSKFSELSNSLIIITLDNIKKGYINELNWETCSIVKYRKSEILNKNFKKLIPDILYFENGFLKKYIGNYDEHNDLEKKIFIKLKSGYITPCYIKYRKIYNKYQKEQLIIKLRVNKYLKNIVYIITDENGEIDSLTANCLSVLKIDNFLVKQKSNITFFFNNILKDAENYKKSIGDIITYKYDKEVIKNYYNDFTSLKIKLKCYLEELVIDNRKILIFKFEPIYNKLKDNIKLKKLTRINKKFLFNINEDLNGFVGFNNIEKLTKSFWENRNSMISKNLKTDDILLNKRESKLKKFNYGKNIKTFRLDYYNNFSNIEEIKDEESEELNSLEIKNNNNIIKDEFEYKLKEDNEDFFNDTFKNKDSLKPILSSKKIDITMKIFLVILFLYLFIILIIYILELSINILHYNKLPIYVNIINQLYLRITENININSKTCLLTLLDKNFNYYNLYNYDKIDLNSIQNSITNSINNIDKIQSLIQLEDLNINIDEKTLNLMNSSNISLLFANGNQRKDNIQDTTNLTIAKASNVINLNSFRYQTRDIFYLINNIMNGYLQKSFDLISSFINNYKIQILSIDNTNLYLMITITICWLLFSLFLIWILNYYLFYKNNILFLFLKIPLDEINKLIKKSENFLSFINLNEDDLNDDNFNKNNDSFDEFKKNKIRKYKISNKIFFRNLLKLITLLIIVSFYIYFVNWFNKFSYKKVYDNINELTNINKYEPLSYIIFNSINLYNLYPDVKVLNKSSLEISKNKLNEIFELDSNLIKDHFSNNNLNHNYHMNFSKIFFNNFCDDYSKIIKNVTITDCKNFASKEFKEGLSIGINNNYQKLLNYLIISEKAKTNNDCLSDNVNKTNCPLNSEYFKEINAFQNLYIKYLFRYLIDTYYQGIIYAKDSFFKSKIIIFIINIWVIVIIYFYILLSFWSNLRKKLHKTKKMILMIPLNQINDIKEIKNFIKENINNYKIN